MKNPSNAVRDFLQVWTKESRLQTVESREEFRREAEALLASTISSGESDEPRIFWFPRTEQFSIRWDGDTPFVRGWQRLYTEAQAAALATQPAESKACASVGVEPVARTDHCQGPECRDGIRHASDCAVHNEPAYPAGPCDCGAKS